MTGKKENKQNLVFIDNGQPFTDTIKMSKGFGVDHRNLKFHIDKHMEFFLRDGIITIPSNKISEKKGKGRPVEPIQLNEVQAHFLATLLGNAPRVVEFKYQMSKEFVKIKKMLMEIAINKKNSEWIEARNNGKIERRIETDAIKEFVGYAMAQGSKSAQKYYMAITKMENTTLFNLELLKMNFKNIREVVNGFGLTMLKQADYVVGLELREGMSENRPYKQIYQDAKERVKRYSEVIGNPPLEKVLGSTKQSMLT